jgi:hypothetical protein
VADLGQIRDRVTEGLRLDPAGGLAELGRVVLEAERYLASRAAK